ncbi:MAG: FtsX-like permease family protein, partial [Burkholderiales bacterium]
MNRVVSAIVTWIGALRVLPLLHGLRSAPRQFAIALGALALGVALGLAIHLINRAALAEFAIGLRSIAGGADLTVAGPRAGFDATIYAKIASLPEVAAASPLVELDARLPDHNRSLRIIGIDVFRALAIQPSLAPIAANDDPVASLRPASIFLAPPVAVELGLKAGDRLRVQSGIGTRELTVAGSLPADIRRPALAVMDIAGAQALLGDSHEVTRIDVRVTPGVLPRIAAQRIAAMLPTGVYVSEAGDAGVAGESLTRAYRVNLTVLALVALFTGALLVFSTQALAVVRRRTELALLRALGVTQTELLWRLLAEAALAGAFGSAVGVALGYLLAWIATFALGADLGAGFFRGVKPSVGFAPVATLAFFLLGVVAAVLGALVPGLEASRAPPARALRAGDDERMWSRLRPWWPGLVLIAVAAVLVLLPPIFDLPLPAYAAIACILFGTILVMPRLAHRAFHWMPMLRSPTFGLALAQLRGAPGQPAVSLAAIVAAVSLAVSMAIMVTSFRDSLDAWLTKLLPADLYLRVGGGNDAGFFDTDAQRAVAAVPGVARVEFLRHL